MLHEWRGAQLRPPLRARADSNILLAEKQLALSIITRSARGDVMVAIGKQLPQPRATHLNNQANNPAPLS